MPNPGSIPGSTAPDSLKIDGTSPNPNQNLPVPAPQGLKGILDGLDIAPQPEAVPKPGGSGGTPLAPPKGSLLPEAAVPETLAPTPGTPATEPSKTRDKDAATPKSSLLSPNVVPAPAAKPDVHRPPQNRMPVSWQQAGCPIARSESRCPIARRERDTHAERPIRRLLPQSRLRHLLPQSPTSCCPITRPREVPSPDEKRCNCGRPSPSQDDMPIRADWNASLGPETVGGNQQRTVSFEQSASKTANPLRNAPERCNPLRRALEGYCPVQLQENDRWVAGKPDLQATYQGQVFYFSSEIARKRFKTTPEKYAPIQGGSDVVMAAEENRAVPGTVNHSAVWHGRLYLFANSATLATFQEDPARYANSARPTTLKRPPDSL